MTPGIFKRIWGVALFVTTIATIAIMWQPAFWATALPEVIVFCLSAGWLALYLINAESLQLNLVVFPLALAVLWPFLQLAIGATIYRWATSIAALYWAACAAVTFIGLQVFRDPANRRWYLRALVIAGAVISIIAPLQLFTSGAKIFWLFEVPYSDVAMGPFVYGNQYAAFIELLLPIALTRVFSDRANWRTVHGLAAVVMYASVLASASRTGFILTSIEIIVVPLLAAKRAGIAWRQLVTSAALFTGMLVILCLAIGPEKLIAKLGQKDPFHGRREYVESSLRMIRDRPLLGVGMGNWPAAYPAYASFDNGFFANQAHSDWAQWTVEGGIPFGLLVLAVAGWALPRAFKTGWGIGVVVVFLQCLVDYPIQRMGVAIVFFTLLAAVAYPDAFGSGDDIAGRHRAS